MALTGGLEHLAAAELVFLASHSLTNMPAFRRPVERALGRRGFLAGYSLLSLALIAWAVAAALAAPAVVLWETRAWMRWVPPLTMPLVCLLWVTGMTTPNPYSIGPGAKGFDAARPGILRLTRHPMLWGFGLWAGAHLVPNGNVAALMLFGPLLALAVAGPFILDARHARNLGPGSAHFALSWRALGREVGVKRFLGGLALYGTLIPLHWLIIGIFPIP